MAVSSVQIYTWLERYAGIVAEQKQYLTGLDAAIGDGDHGINMDRGFQTGLVKLAPARERARQYLGEGAPLEEVLAAAADAAEEGMKATIPLKALKGRASYLGDRSIGHQDPGATSSYLMLRALSDSLAALPQRATT